MSKLSMPLGKVCNPGFLGALQKLIVATDDKGRTLLSGREHFALSKTIRKIRTESEIHREATIALLKKHGAISNLSEIRDTIAKIQAKGDRATREEKESLEGIQKKMPQLEANEQLSLHKSHPNYDVFKAEQDDLDNPDFELSLDRKIVVVLEKIKSGGDPATTLNALEMEALEPIVEFVEDYTPAPSKN